MTSASEAAAAKKAAAAKLKQDTLKQKEWANTTGFSWETVKDIPGLDDVFKQAIEEDWISSETGFQKFNNAVQNLKWVQENGVSLLNYQKAKAKGGENWLAQERDALTAVQAAAVKVGAELDAATAKRLADSYMMFGWQEDPENLTKALTGQLEWTTAGGKTYKFGEDYLNYGRGEVATNIQNLKKTAYDNGIQYDDNWYNAAAKSVAAGLRTVDDWKMEMRRTASGMWPAWTNQIESGMSARDLASPYINRYAQILELDPNQISLDDPTLRNAIAGRDANGQYVPMGLSDFENSLRQDPRWEKTKDGQNKLVGGLQAMMKEWGFVN